MHRIDRIGIIVALVAAAFLGGCASANLRQGLAPGEEPGALTPGELRCEYRTNPLGIDETAPRLSWTVASEERSQRQSAYRIQVATSEEKLWRDEPDLWDSGEVESDATSQIVYRGARLASRMPCHWRVRVWDRDGAPSPWSYAEPAFWTMGLLEPGDWRAGWIGLDGVRVRKDVPLDRSIEGAKWIWFPEASPPPPGMRYFRRAFTIPAGARISDAVLTYDADNIGRLFVNGKQVTKVTDSPQAVQVDIADYLRDDLNAIAIEVANTGDDPSPAGVIASVRILFEDGEPLVILSGDTWKASREKELLWQTHRFEDSAWKAAREIGDFGCDPWGRLEIKAARLFLPPPPYLRKSFALEKPVRSAYVHATALGLYELHINGRKVGEDFFRPGWTDYAKRVYYQTYDVTEIIRTGENAVGAILADGWYAGYIGWERKRDHYGERPRVRVQLEVEYEDGTRDVIASDATWKASTGPIIEADFLMGEIYDARREIAGWDEPGFDDASWRGVDVTPSIDVPVEAYPGVPVRALGEVDPVSVSEPREGVHVFDLGQNFAGFARLKVSAPAGTRIVLRFAERLEPDGTIYTTNLRSARATDVYICRGGGIEVWQPRFTFHGFQYVEVTGLPEAPDLETIAGIPLSSDTAFAGDFACSDPIAERLFLNAFWTQTANFIEIPTDCPQRDERLGWTGDAQIYIRTATYNADVAAFFTKWLVDLVDARLEDGAFPDVAPRRVATGGGTAAWADAGIVCPWTIHWVYGDTRILEKHYDALAGWIEYCRRNSTGLLRPAKGYGDWLSIRADTPKDVLATAYFARATDLMARIARAVGKDDDATKYRKLFEEIRDAFDRAYVGEDVRIEGDTQTVYVLALAFD
ncbi:MAG: family 78 glycoside hydrolase catalytic domain, partial [Planctomycetes bacterium]|nr:family 78 glycoside hydrolase catalytic domain [Planctomycetota bacterium]